MSERETSQVTDALNNRILANQRFGSANLSDWLLSHLALQKQESVLEIGCGTGKHLIEFAKATETPYSCTGMDISQSSLENAAKSATESGVRINWIRKSMDDLDDHFGSYQTVAAIYSLYYSKNTRDTMANMHRLLTPNGRIVVMGPYSDNNKEWFDFIDQFMTLPDSVKKSTTSFMYDDVLKYATEHFSNITCHRFVNTIQIPSKQELERYWKSNIYYKEEHDAAFDKCAEKYFSEQKSFQYSKVGLLICMDKPFASPPKKA